MGYAEEPVPDPQNFLKKQQNDTKQNAAKDSKLYSPFSPKTKLKFLHF